MPCIINENVSEKSITLNENTETLNRVIQNSLTNAEFDLEVHGSPVSHTPTEHLKVGPGML